MGIFEPYRAIGYITDNVPFSVQRRGSENFVTVSVGKAFQIYNCAKLTLVLVGPQLEKKIRALASWRDFTYAATSRSIIVFKRAHQVSVLNAHEGKVSHLLSFGNHILSLGTDRSLFVWDVVNIGLKGDVVPIKKLHLGEHFFPSCLMHPDAYLNKVLIGSEEGSLQLWNINTGKMLYRFQGWGSPVWCCVSSPALDVVGIGCGDGKIRIHNIKYDESVATFTHTTRGGVTALSFRTDGQPFLAAGGSCGVISIWNLEKKRLQAVIKDAHDSSICSLHFLPNEPVLLSAAGDNSLKMWIFDRDDGEARLLRFRNGHSAPPTCIRYYGNGQYILSAGQDRAFRLFSTIQDQQSRELSQGHVAKKAKRMKVKEEELKLPPVVAFAKAEIRERDWCNVVTCHMDHNRAYSWRLQNFVIGEHLLKPGCRDGSAIKACAISACGNFAVLGTESGYIERFNLQSGMSRGIYCDVEKGGDYAHTGEVVGLACDGTNAILISGGYDSYIKVWDFKSCCIKTCWPTNSPLVKLDFHRGNGLLAVASDDFVICLYDVVAARLVRQFKGHIDRITDLCFSEDGKWILSSAMDGTVRVWDVVGSKQIDAMHVEVAVTALSISPGMDMLATTHVGHNGIYLWANRFMYSGMINVESFGSGKSVVRASMPTVSSACNELESNGISLPSVEVNSEQNFESSRLQDLSAEEAQSLPDLVTLAMLPKAQWQSLINLDLIKMRNKPTAPPKKPEKAPFFLPTLPSVSREPIFVLPSTTDESQKENDKIKEQSLSHFRNKPGHEGFDSPFLQVLHLCSDTHNYAPFVSFLKGLSPPEIDLELRMLYIVDEDESLDDNKSEELIEIGIILDFFVDQMESKRDFEFIQALLQLFLKIHGESILRHPYLQGKANKLLDCQRHTWEKLDYTFQNVRSMLGFFSNSLYI